MQRDRAGRACQGAGRGDGNDSPVQMAGDGASARHPGQGGAFPAADVHGLRAARMEAAAGGNHAGHLAHQHLALAPGFGIGVGHRHRRQQRPGIGMQRLAKQRVPIRHFDDAAQVHHRDAVADVAHHRQVVRDEEIGQAQPLLQFHQHVDHLGLDRHVERRHRLVADHQAGLQRQCPRDRDALALPAGELVRIAIRHVGQQAHRGQQRGHSLAILGAAGRDAVHRQRLADDVAHLHARIQRAVRILVDHLHAAAEAPGRAVLPA